MRYVESDRAEVKWQEHALEHVAVRLRLQEAKLCLRGEELRGQEEELRRQEEELRLRDEQLRLQDKKLKEDGGALDRVQRDVANAARKVHGIRQNVDRMLKQLVGMSASCEETKEGRPVVSQRESEADLASPAVQSCEEKEDGRSREGQRERARRCCTWLGGIRGAVDEQRDRAGGLHESQHATAMSTWNRTLMVLWERVRYLRARIVSRCVRTRWRAISILGFMQHMLCAGPKIHASNLEYIGHG